MGRRAKQLRRCVVVTLLLGAVLAVAACDPSVFDDSQGQGQNPGQGGGGDARGGTRVDSPIVGEWHSSSAVADFLYSQRDLTTYGGGGTGTGYCFRADGTYTSYIVTTGYGLGSLAGWVIEDGKYRIEGNQVVMYDRYATAVNSDDPESSRGRQPQNGNKERTFEVLANGNLQIQNTTTYADGTVGFDVLVRSSNESDFANLRN
ncbi:MAG: hypothetical protein FWF02_06790 [Micrococcales bacterium]|nr:hypothetical protein [Micrococcales bacterium]MCL2667399.1 hypothetical protein [Micrococcales bacterium]